MPRIGGKSDFQSCCFAFCFGPPGKCEFAWLLLPVWFPGWVLDTDGGHTNQFWCCWTWWAAGGKKGCPGLRLFSHGSSTDGSAYLEEGGSASSAMGSEWDPDWWRKIRTGRCVKNGFWHFRRSGSSASEQVGVGGHHPRKWLRQAVCFPLQQVWSRRRSVKQVLHFRHSGSLRWSRWW